MLQIHRPQSVVKNSAESHVRLRIFASPLVKDVLAAVIFCTYGTYFLPWKERYSGFQSFYHFHSFKIAVPICSLSLQNTVKEKHLFSAHATNKKKRKKRNCGTFQNSPQHEVKNKSKKKKTQKKRFANCDEIESGECIITQKMPPILQRKFSPVIETFF